MNIKKRIEALEKVCGLGGDIPPDLVIIPAGYEITPEEEIEIEKERDRLTKESKSPYPVLVFWPPLDR